MGAIYFEIQTKLRRFSYQKKKKVALIIRTT